MTCPRSKSRTWRSWDAARLPGFRLRCALCDLPLSATLGARDSLQLGKPLSKSHHDDILWQGADLQPCCPGVRPVRPSLGLSFLVSKMGREESSEDPGSALFQELMGSRSGSTSQTEQSPALCSECRGHTHCWQSGWDSSRCRHLSGPWPPEAQTCLAKMLRVSTGNT